MFVSAVPQNFKETLETYTRQGFRVIALAHHRLDSELPWLQVQSLSRYAFIFYFKSITILAQFNVAKIKRWVNSFFSGQAM